MQNVGRPDTCMDTHKHAHMRAHACMRAQREREKGWGEVGRLDMGLAPICLHTFSNIDKYLVIS